MASFNLVNDPWIPCLGAAGTVQERSIRGCLVEAPELVAIAASSPIVAFALHRLLLAVLHSALRGPASLAEAAGLLEARAFEDRVGDYLDLWQERFELFGEHRPFMQPGEKASEPRTVAVLVHEWAAGNNTTLADHHVDAEPPVLTAGAAARALVTSQAFAVGGGVSKPFNLVSAAVTPRIACLLTGSSVLETLVANLVRYEPGSESPMPSAADDAPCWERDEDPEPRKDGTVPTGWLDYLTWQPRAIRLMPDEDGSVRSCLMRQYLSLPKPPPRDPHTPYRIDDKEGRIPLRIRAGRALWRDAHAIVLGLLPDRDTNPDGVLAWGIEVSDLGGQVDGLMACGLDIRQAKITHWVTSWLPAAPSIAEDADRTDALRRAIEYADGDATNALRRAVRALYTVQGSPPPTERSAKAAFWAAHEEAFWPGLEASFARLLTELGDTDSRPEPGLERWKVTVHAAARHALERAVEAIPPTGRGYEASAAATREFRRALPRPKPRVAAEAA